MNASRSRGVGNIWRRCGLVAAGTLGILWLAAGCGGAGDQAPAVGDQPNAVVVSSDLAVGENRFSLGLLSQDNELVSDADVAFKFYRLEDDERRVRFEAEARRIVAGAHSEDQHEGDATEGEGPAEVVVYVADVEFDEAGPWGVEVSGSRAGQVFETVTAAFSVLETGKTPAVGEPAPRSVQTLLSDVQDIEEVCTSDPPIPEMHEMTIADAVTSGRPTVIAFATPAFCRSRVCGPTMEAVNALYESYGDEVNFVHVEPYDIEKARSGEALVVVPFLEDEWGMVAEPWVFIIDADGNVAAKFEAAVSEDELDRALQEVL